MSTTDIEPPLEVEDLARARKMTQQILEDWDFTRWNDLLADDVRLSVKIGSIDVDRIGSLAAVGGNLQVSGREDVKRVLESIYDDIRRGLSVTSEILSGYDVVLVGNFELEGTEEGADSQSWPIVIYMAFNTYGEIIAMTIAAVDMKPLTDAFRSAVQTSILNAA